MNQKTIITIITLAMLSTIAFPIINIFITTPAFTSYIVKQNEKRLTEMAYNISSAVDIRFSTREDMLLNNLVIDKINEMKSLFKLEKIKIFSTKGKIIYSTDPIDIGNQSSKSFFDSIVKDSKPFSVLEIKKEESTTNEETERTIVETYVPITNKNVTLGVFEIYYDISEEKEKLGKIIASTNLTILAIFLLLLLSVFASAIFAYKNLTIQKKIEREKDKLIKDLSAAVDEIKALRGIIPVCYNCMKVRADDGFWKQVDVYLNKHSEANVSHGLCPECYEKEIEKIEKHGSRSNCMIND